MPKKSVPPPLEQVWLVMTWPDGTSARVATFWPMAEIVVAYSEKGADGIEMEMPVR